MTHSLDLRRKRIRLRAWRRGFKEMDLVLGRFADLHLAALDLAGIAAFEALLDQPDQDVFGWIIGQVQVPAEFDTTLMSALQSFRVDRALSPDLGS